jgi:hypothetical protein
MCWSAACQVSRTRTCQRGGARKCLLDGAGGALTSGNAPAAVGLGERIGIGLCMHHRIDVMLCPFQHAHDACSCLECTNSDVARSIQVLIHSRLKMQLDFAPGPCVQYAPALAQLPWPQQWPGSSLSQNRQLHQADSRSTAEQPILNDGISQRKSHCRSRDVRNDGNMIPCFVAQCSEPHCFACFEKPRSLERPYSRNVNSQGMRRCSNSRPPETVPLIFTMASATARAMACAG